MVLEASPCHLLDPERDLYLDGEVLDQAGWANNPCTWERLSSRFIRALFAVTGDLNGSILSVWAAQLESQVARTESRGSTSDLRPGRNGRDQPEIYRQVPCPLSPGWLE